MCSAGMPMPLSITEKYAPSASTHQRIRTVPSARVYFIPFTSRLVNADSSACAAPNNPAVDSNSNTTWRGRAALARASRCNRSSIFGPSTTSRTDPHSHIDTPTHPRTTPIHPLLPTAHTHLHHPAHHLSI